MQSKFDSKKDIFLLVDSNALIHRAYHAYPPTLTNPRTGLPINAAYGFTTMMLDMIAKFKPKYIACAFDTAAPNLRKAEYVGYKANRKETDIDLVSQFAVVEEIVEAFGIPIYKVDGFEADDVIGTVSEKLKDQDIQTVIFTGDHDILQLVEANKYVFMSGFNFKQSKLYDEAEVLARYEFGPEFISDYKALRGDPSDNIPGVKGVGQKTATELIKNFGHIDQIYNSIENIKPERLKTKLSEEYDIAMMSKKLTTIIRDVPLNFTLEECSFDQNEVEKVRKLFQEFRFVSLIKKLPKVDTSITNQMDMFAINSQPTSNLSEVDDISKIKTDKELFISYDDKEIAFEDYNENFIKLVLTTDKDKIQKLFDTNAVVVVYDYKNLLNTLAKFELTHKNNFEDVMLLSYLLYNGDLKINLYDIAFNVLSVTLEESLRSHVEVAKALYDQFIKDITKEGNERLLSLYTEIEKPIARILSGVEQHGMYLDKVYLSKLKIDLTKELKGIEKEIYDSVGHEFNVNSPKQLGEILFVELQLPGGKKTKSGGYSTDERKLRDLIDAHPVINLVMQYRELNKLISTYTDVLIDKVDPKTDRIHTKLNQAVAATGRLSSIDPNLQNIPISSEKGLLIRKAFQAPEGKVLLGFDIAQQELRVAAILSGEQKLIDAFKNNEDIHTLTASEVFDIKLEEVDNDKRRVGKTLNYSILYGISAFGLADRLKMDIPAAKEIINKFWTKFDKLRRYFDDNLMIAKEKGYVESLFGRRRSAKGLVSSNFLLRAATEREILNFPIQGASADLMKKSMINASDYLETTKDDIFGAKIILQVHDELILEIDDVEYKNIEKFAAKIKDEMEKVGDFPVKIVVEPKIGKNWSEMKKIDM